jgi:hypothetical protein
MTPRRIIPYSLVCALALLLFNWLALSLGKIGFAKPVLSMPDHIASDYAFSPWAGNWRNFKIIAHEFGHNLGLTHAPVNSPSIMSYDASRSVIGEDLSHVATGYGGGP